MFRKYSRCFFLVILVYAFLTAPTMAKEPQLPEVEVVSTPIVEDIRITNDAVQITTVSEKQIESLNALDLLSALRRVPGVTISRFNLVGSYGGAAGGAIYLRGMGAERPGAEIQTLIDGRPVFQGIFTHPLMDLLGVDNIDRIDIYKSPQPVSFGNMSYGVVNIITKRKTTEGIETKAGLTYGEHNTLNSYIKHCGKVNGWDYNLIGSYKKSDGHRDNADGELQNYFARIGKELSKHWDVTLTLLHTDNWAQDPGRLGAAVPPVIPRFASKSTAFDLTVSNRYENTTGFAKIYFEDGEVRWRQYDTAQKHVFFSNSDWKTKGLKIEQKTTPWSGGELTVGYDYIRYGGAFEEVRPTSRRTLDETYFYNSAPYVSISHTFGEVLQVIPSVGVRYNMSKEFDDDIGWQSGLVVRYKDTEFHARYAKGFNLPGVYAVFQYTKMWNQGDKWKTIKPELINHYEIGISHAFTNWLKGSLTAFWNYGKDRFIFKSPPPRFENLESYHIRGEELTLTLNPMKDLEMFFGVTHQNRSPENLPYSPKISMTSGINWQFMNRFLLSTDAQYVASRYVGNPRYPTATPDKVGAYLNLNARLNYRLTDKGSPFETNIFISGENLTNRKYEFLKGYPAPGRTMMAGVNVSF